MEKYIYWRQTSGVSGDQDETSGSVMMPVSRILGITAGDGTATDDYGTITDDDDRFTIFLNPMRVPGTGAGATTAAQDRPDILVLNVTSGDFDFKGLYEELLGYINKPGAHHNGMITLYDGVTGTGLTGVTGIHDYHCNILD